MNRRDFLIGLGAAGATAILPAFAYAKESFYYYSASIAIPQQLQILFACSDALMLRVRDVQIKPPLASRAYGLAHLAGFTAMNAITGNYTQSYRVGRGPQDADLNAAYAAAFFDVAGMATGGNFDVELRGVLNAVQGPGKAAGIAWGKKVGHTIRRWRSHDGADHDSLSTYYGEFQKTAGPLAWEPTLPYYSRGVRPRAGLYDRALYPGFGNVKPLSARSIRPFRVDHFPDVRSSEFARMLHKVDAIGSMESRERTKDQEHIAWFWEDGPRSATPAGHFLLFAMQVIAQRNMQLEPAARLLAKQCIAMADAGIIAWDAKYAYDIVRPETLLRKRGDHLRSYNSRLYGKSGWRALIPTPPFPAYTSGHSCFGAAGGHMLQLEVGDAINITERAPDAVNWPHQLIGTTRHFRSIETAVQENGDSREYGGVHWEADNIQGLKAGRAIARHVHENIFLPVS